MTITLRTPRGHVATFEVRPDTTDAMTAEACCAQDEYGLADRTWTGTALDIGAHIGGVTVMLGLDNPELRIVAVEALPENVAVLRTNVARNGLDGRVTVYEAGAGQARIAYGASDTDFARCHRFIGNGDWQAGGTVLAVTPLTLSTLVVRHGPFSLAKIDCEGCEWSFLDDPGTAAVAEWRGEYHPRNGHGPVDLRRLLRRHAVTCDDALPFGPFQAVLS